MGVVPTVDIAGSIAMGHRITTRCVVVLGRRLSSQDFDNLTFWFPQARYILIDDNGNTKIRDVAIMVPVQILEEQIRMKNRIVKIQQHCGPKQGEVVNVYSRNEFALSLNHDPFGHCSDPKWRIKKSKVIVSAFSFPPYVNLYTKEL